MDKASSSNSSSKSGSSTSKKNSSSSVSSGVASQGANRFGSDAKGTNTQSAYSAALSGLYVTSPSDVNYDYLDYFIVTVDRNTTSINWSSLKQNNVAGVIIEAGYLYNAAHVEQYYRNPRLHDQAIGASKADMPFGLYCDCKARSVAEAKKELYQLSFCIRKYPPVLGMWVHFQLVKSKTINDQIVDYYKKYLIQLGLIDNIGILATESELKNISWFSKHYKDWSLWLNKHVSNISEVKTLLQPEMFSVKE